METSFIEFVNKQPDERALNHSSWSSCAIGEFADEGDFHPHEISNIILNENCYLWELLNNAVSTKNVSKDKQNSIFCIDTYGDLKKKISQLNNPEFIDELMEEVHR